MVALHYVGKYVVVVGVASACNELVVASFGAYFGACRYKYFELGVGEYGCAYVAAVHYDALRFAHFALLVNQRGAYEIDRCNVAHQLRHLECAYFVLYVRAVKICDRIFCFGIGAEGYFYVVNLLAQCLLINLAISDYSVLHAVECNGAIHGTAVEIEVTYVSRKRFCHSALSTRRKSVDCYSYLFHNAYDILNRNDDEDTCSLLYDAPSFTFLMARLAPAVMPSHLLPDTESSCDMR